MIKCPNCKKGMVWFEDTLVCPICDEFAAIRELQWSQDMKKGIKYCREIRK